MNRAEGETEAPAPWGRYAPGVLGKVVLWISHHTPLGRGTPRKALFGAFRQCHGGAVDTWLWGTPVRLHPTWNVCEKKALMRPDRMDAVEHGVLRAAMTGADKVMVDVGANAGLYTLSAALSAKSGSTLIAIEPNSDLQARLAFNLREGQRQGMIAPDVTLIPVVAAVSDRDGDAVLVGQDDEGGRHLSSSGEGLKVMTRPLTAIVADAGVGRIDVMKIDVEGHEDRVLPPYFAAIDNGADFPMPGWIIIEHVSRARWQVDCISQCLEKGYLVVATTRNNTILKL